MELERLVQGRPGLKFNQSFCFLPKVIFSHSPFTCSICSMIWDSHYSPHYTITITIITTIINISSRSSSYEQSKRKIQQEILAWIEGNSWLHQWLRKAEREISGTSGIHAQADIFILCLYMPSLLPGVFIHLNSWTSLCEVEIIIVSPFLQMKRLWLWEDSVSHLGLHY